MSTFKVDVRKISKVWDHSNADRLSLASVEGLGYQFVTGKDQFKVGDLVAYFPIDSILPDNLIELFGLTGKLSGKEKNRISTVKLRGELSQGFVSSIETLQPLVTIAIEEGHDLTDVLGVVKYDPPPIACQAGKLVPLPDGVSMYDIEGCERFPEIVDLLMDQRVTITEKVEGQNYGVTVTPEDDIIVNQRKHAIKALDTGPLNSLISISRKMNLDKLAIDIKKYFKANQVTLRGEYIGPGVQKNIYKLKENTVKLFDVLVDGRYISWLLVKEIVKQLRGDEVETLLVPDIYVGNLREWLDGRSVVEASHGKSMLADTLREGAVIKPIEEQDNDDIGRLIIKCRDPEYLAKNGF